MHSARRGQLGLQHLGQRGGLDVGGNPDDRVRVHRALELGRGAEREQAPVVDDRDPVAEPVGFLHVVRDQQDRLPGLVQLAHDLVQSDPALRVEPGRRLVEEQHGRAVHDRARDHQPLRHPAGECIDRLARDVREREPLEQRLGLHGGIGGAHPEVAAVEEKVLADAEAAVEGVVLGDDADELACERGPRDDVGARHPRTPLAGEHPGRQHSCRRGLAGPVGPEQAEDLAAPDGEIEAGDGNGAPCVHLRQAGRPDRLVASGRGLGQAVERPFAHGFVD
jgi:hypothetical protein